MEDHRFVSTCRRSKVYQEKKELAKRFRKEPTRAEEKAWNLLRSRRCMGLKFRRQQVIGGFIVDFYCPALGLVLEVDGGVHDRQEAQDKEREEVLCALGLRVVRIRNENVSKRRLEELFAPFVGLKRD